jgi:peptidoglycan hydrolase CwlO-like protein
MSKRITTEDFTLPLEFLTKSGDGVEIRTEVEVVAHLEDARAFKQKFILEPSKFDISQLASHLSELDEMKELVNAESAAYNAEYLFGDPMVANQIAEKLKEPLSQILKERGLKFTRIERLSPVRVKPLPRPSTSTPLGMTPSASGKGLKLWHKPFVITGIVLLIVAAGFIYYYVQASSEISKNNTTISSLQKDVTTYKSLISSLQNDIASYGSQVSSLQNQLASANAQVSPLQNENASLKSQITNLNNELSSANSQITSANSQITSLQSQNSDLQKIVSLSKSTIKANQLTINQSAGQETTVVTFTADYAGYVYVSGTSTTSNGYIHVTDSSSYYPSKLGTTPFYIGTNGSVSVPVLPGTIRVIFGNDNLFSGATATITVTYYY